MSKRTLSVMGALAISALVLAGCSGGEKSKEVDASFSKDSKAEITFAWWGNDERAARFEKALAAFNEEYPNITVVRNFNSWGDYWTSRNTEAAGKSLPDAVMLDAGYLGEYSSKNLLMDLAPYKKAMMPLEGVPDNVLESGTVNGKLVSVPLGTNAFTMMYNKDVLDDLGVAYPAENMTWDELNKFIEEVDEAGKAKSPRVYGAEDYTGGLPGFIYHLMQQGREVFTEDGKAAFTEQDVISYIDAGSSLRDKGQFYPIERSVALSPRGGFLAAEAAIWFNFSTTVQQAMTDIGTENIGMVAPPLGEGKDKHVLAPKPSMLLSVAANSKSPEAAAALVNFLATSPKVAEIFGTSLGTPPTEEGRAAIKQEPADTVNLDYLKSVDSELTAGYPILPAGYGTIEAKWTELHERFQYGELTSEQFAKELFSEISMALGS